MPRGLHEGSVIDQGGKLYVRVRYTDAAGTRREKKRAIYRRSEARDVKLALYDEIRKELEGAPTNGAGADGERGPARKGRPPARPPAPKAPRAVTVDQLVWDRIESVVSESVKRRVWVMEAAIDELRAEVRELRERQEPDGSALITLAEAEDLTGIPYSRFRDAIKDGLLNATRPGQAFKVRVDEAKRFARRVLSASAVKGQLSPEAVEDAKRDRLRAQLAECQQVIADAKRLARQRLSSDWRAAVREAFPALSPQIIEMLPSEKPSAIAAEHVAQSEGMSGRQLWRFLRGSDK